MEVHRIEQICAVVRESMDAHGSDDRAVDAALRARHVTAVDIAEALDDIGRLGDASEEASSLLQFALTRPARPASR